MKKHELLAEFLGTFLLLVVVVGSGIMGETLAGGNTAIALLGNSIATGAGLFVLIHIFGPISGAHFNPAVTFYFRLDGAYDNAKMLAYWGAQILGGACGVWFTHLMFDQPILQVSLHARDGLGLFSSEILATFGLLLTILGFQKNAGKLIPAGVALYITGAYWFTSSTSFANPAVTLARTLSNTFAGIAPHSLTQFIAAQFLGVILFKAVWAVLNEPEIAVQREEIAHDVGSLSHS